MHGCFVCRTWSQVGDLCWQRLLGFLDQHVEPLVGLEVEAFSFPCSICFLALILSLLLLFLNVINTFSYAYGVNFLIVVPQKLVEICAHICVFFFCVCSTAHI